jgi:hypothetical protein
MRNDVLKVPLLSLKEMNRLLAAAIVSPEFREYLLENPIMAMKAGYNGTPFLLTDEERAVISNIQAATLAEFAAQLKRSDLGKCNATNH